MGTRLTSIWESIRTITQNLGWIWSIAIVLIICIIGFYAINGIAGFFRYEIAEHQASVATTEAKTARDKADEYLKDANEYKGQADVYRKQLNDETAVREKLETDRQNTQLELISLQNQAKELQDTFNKAKNAPLRYGGNLDQRVSDLGARLDKLTKPDN